MGYTGIKSLGRGLKELKKFRDKLNPSFLKKLQEVKVKKYTPPYRVKKAIPKMKRKP